MDVLTEGGDNPQLRAGVLRLLSTVPEVTVVNSTTEKKGAVETGAKVNVHYTVDGKNWVATAITVAPAKAAKSKGKK